MINEALNIWKKTQLQKAQQAIHEELETRKAQQESWREKLHLSDLQSMMTPCKEAEADGNSDISTDVSLTKASLDVLRNKLSSLCDTIQALINDNSKLSSSPSPLTPSNAEDTYRSHIHWDFIVHLCSSAGPQKDPYIPKCVKRVANMYNHTRNREFLKVVHDKRKGREERLLCIFKYFCNSEKNNIINGTWLPQSSQDAEFLSKWRDVCHDPEYANEI